MKRLFTFKMPHFLTGGGLFFPWQRESPTTVMFGDIRSETTLLIFEIQQIASCLQLTWYQKIHLCTVSLFLADRNHKSCYRVPIGPPSDSFISPVEQHNRHSFDSTFCLLWSSVGAPSKGIVSSSCSCRAVGCTWVKLFTMVDIEDDEDDYTEDDNYGNIDDDYGDD